MIQLLGMKRIQGLKFLLGKLHGYTVHQQYPTLYFPTNAHIPSHSAQYTRLTGHNMQP